MRPTWLNLVVPAPSFGRKRSRHSNMDGVRVRHAAQSAYSGPVREFMEKASAVLVDVAPAQAAGEGACPIAECGRHVARPRIALLSNPRSTGNLAQLPRIR